MLGILIPVFGGGIAIGKYFPHKKSDINPQQQQQIQQLQLQLQQMQQRESEDLTINSLKDKIRWIKTTREDFGSRLGENSSPEDRVVYPRLINEWGMKIKELEDSLDFILEKQERRNR
jgi:hypothetical protein